MDGYEVLPEVILLNKEAFVIRKKDKRPEQIIRQVLLKLLLQIDESMVENDLISLVYKTSESRLYSMSSI